MNTPPTTRSARVVVDAVCIVSVFIFLAVAVWSVWTGGGGLYFDQWMTFVVVPVLSATLVTFGFLSSPEGRSRTALLLVGLTGGLLCAETGTRLIAMAGERWADGAPMWDDGEATFRTLMDLRARGIDAFPTIPGNVLVDRNPTFDLGTTTVHPITPTVGGSTAVLCAEGGTPVIYGADRFGFNNPDSVWDANSIDVALVGDSYTQGVCVPDRHQPGNLLRANHMVVNLGIRGAGPLQELAALREFGESLTPSTVIWIYFEGNDLWDLAREAQRSWLVDYLDGGHAQGLANQQAAVDARLRAWLDSIVSQRGFRRAEPGTVSPAIRLADVLQLSNLRRLAGFGVLTPRRESDLGLLPDILSRARADVAAWGGRFVLVYIPTDARYRMLVGEGSRGRRELRAFAEVNRFRFVDMDSVFAVLPDPERLWAFPGGHPNPEGYALVASTLMDVLDERPAVPTVSSGR